LRATLDIEADRARRGGGTLTLTLAVLDIDGFRSLNTRAGHGMGDQALRTVADVLRKHTRPQDKLSRTAADEFAVLMPEIDVPTAVSCCDHVLKELEGGVGAVESGHAGQTSGGRRPLPRGPRRADQAATAALAPRGRRQGEHQP
jgi:diguanylate cyclase (GGDEF)-like protein